MEVIKFISKLFLSFISGFLFWYMIFFFISTEANAFAWHWITKIAYLLLSFAASSGIFKALMEE